MPSVNILKSCILAGCAVLLLMFQAGTVQAQGSQDETAGTDLVDTRVIFDGYRGWEKEGVTYRLACGPILVQCANGDLLCTWLSGTDQEPATDNCVLMSRSVDGGETWCEPSIFIAPGSQAAIVTNIHRAADNTLVVLGAEWPSEQQYCEWHYFKIESADNGLSWSTRVPVEARNNTASITDGPVKLADDKYLYAGNFTDKRETPLRAAVADLARVKSEEEALDMPVADTADNADLPGKFGDYRHGCCVFGAESEKSTQLETMGYIANRPLGFTEARIIQLRDQSIAMFMRAEWGGFLWRSDSYDQGRSWTPARQTDIPNPSSLIDILRLPQGRIALLHNPSGGIVGQRGPRSPLSVWISADEMKTWSVKKDLFSGGSLAYPCGIILDGKLAFAFDKNRRQIIFVKLDI